MRKVRRFATTTFLALSVRNYRNYFFGNLVSNAGTHMQTIALGWLVLDLSHQSGVAVGVVVALQFLPMLLFSPWGGVIADRFEKRRVLILSQAFQAAMAAALAALTLGGAATLGTVYVLTFLFGLSDAFAMPARQGFAPELVPTDLVPNAVGLNSMGFNLARIAGPAVAGLIIVAAGPGYCFLANAVSYVAVIRVLLLMRRSEMRLPEPIVRARGQIRAGFSYLWREPELRSNLLFMVVVGTLAVNFPVVLPLLAKVTFHGNADVYSAMSIAMGAGAILGAVVVARRAHTKSRLLFVSALVFGLSMVVGALVPTLGIFIVVLVVMGAGMMALVGTNNAIVQMTADAQMRGRVMGVYNMAVLGTTPIGGPLIGWISSVTNPRVGLVVGGVATLASALVFTADAFGIMGTRTGERRVGTARAIGRWALPSSASDA